MVNEIVEREWKFFQQVNNIGGRASCQDDPDTFFKQRKAQFMAFEDEVNISYLNYLKECEANGRNPLTEKYAYMMKDSDPEYYESIKDQLPIIDESTLKIANIIVTMQLGMREQFNLQYPNLAKLSRLTYSSEDSDENTSFETYLRGELLSYNAPTLAAYATMMIRFIGQEKNLIAMIMTNTVREYGYQSLAEANEAYQ